MSPEGDRERMMLALLHYRDMKILDGLKERTWQKYLTADAAVRALSKSEDTIREFEMRKKDIDEEYLRRQHEQSH